MKIKTTIYSNVYYRRLEKFEELIKGKTPIKQYVSRSHCYFESDNEVIQTSPLLQSQRGIKNHYAWIDTETDYELEDFYMVKYSLIPAQMMYDSLEDYRKNEYLHLKYF